MSVHRFFPRLAASLLTFGAAVSAAFAEPITLTDQGGRTVTLPKAAERIASIPIPMASTIIAMDGGTSKLVGDEPDRQVCNCRGRTGQDLP